MGTYEIQFPVTWEKGVGGRLGKPHFFRLIGYDWHQEVVGRFHASEARLRIASAPARTSKSWSTHAEVCWEATPDFAWNEKRGLYQPVRNKLIWIIGPTYWPNKEFDYAWQQFVDRRKRHWKNGFRYHIARQAHTPNQGNLNLELAWGENVDGEPVVTRIEGRSSTNPETLQQEEVDLVVLSEAAEHPEQTWSRYCATRARRAIFPTTPKIKAHWIQELIQLGEAGDFGIDSFAFTPGCNPTYDWDRYWEEHAKAESRVAGRILSPAYSHDCFDPGCDCPAMKDAYFAEQFGGHWTMEGDRVLPFRRDLHVVDTIPEWFAGSKRFVAVDYGYADPAAVLWFAVASDGTMLLYREIYEPKLDPGDLVNRILEASKNDSVDYFVGDPQKPEVEAFYRKIGLPVHVRNKRQQADRRSGYLRLIDALSVDPLIGRPKLFVLSERCGYEGYGCPNTIREWTLLRRKSDFRGDEFSTAAIDNADHAADAARYALSSNPVAPRSLSYDWEREWAEHCEALEERDARRASMGNLTGMTHVA